MPLGSSIKSAFSPDVTQPRPDRRGSPRYEMAGGVYAMIEGLEATKIGTVRDISLGGVYVQSHEYPPIGEFLRLQFRIGADFEISGHVCRKENTGFAVRFEPES